MSVQSSRSTAAEIRETAHRRGGIAKANSSETPREAWLIVALLFMFMLINFADKAVIGIAAVPIMKELKLSPRQFGLIGSSFFLLFSVSAIVTGFIVNRVQTRWALLTMGLVWALTQFPMLGTVGFGTLVACRIALGAGEGPAYPVALHSAYKWFPNELRTLPTAIIAQGAGIGIMVALPLLNWIIVKYSWHWAFGVLGIAGLAWTAAWLMLGREGSLTTATATDAAPTPPKDRLPAVVAKPDDHCELVREFRRPVGVVAGPVLAGSISNQRARLYAGLDRPVGRASGGCQRDPGNRRRLVVRNACSLAECRAGWRAGSSAASASRSAARRWRSCRMCRAIPPRSP